MGKEQLEIQKGETNIEFVRYKQTKKQADKKTTVRLVQTGKIRRIKY